MNSLLTTRRLPLHDRHAEKKAKFGTFGDWEVPLYYSTILEEHEAVRRQAGLFDISHMGEFFFKGGKAESFLQYLLPRDVKRLSNGQAFYTVLLNEKGGIVDDIILYCQAANDFLMIVNAENVDKDFQWIQGRLMQGVDFFNASDQKGLLALQGPQSPEIIRRLFGPSYASLNYYHFASYKNGVIARAGYTGEDGFEIMVDRRDLPKVWDEIFAKAGDQVVPAGFGARDTLRLEAGMLLYGHDMDDETTPFEAGIDWTIDIEKPDFIGRKQLLEQKEKGITKRLIGFEMIDRGIPRQGYEIARQGKTSGMVTSGSFAPTLQKNIGMGYVNPQDSDIDVRIEIKIRSHSVKAKIVKRPFYKRKK